MTLASGAPGASDAREPERRRCRTAREFFEDAREAALDAERIRRELARMDENAAALGGGGFGGRVRSTPDPDSMGRRVAALLDRGERLRAREEADYALIDRACAILYGPDNRSGLYALVGWPADAIYHHFLALRTWEETADILGYSERHVLDRVSTAFDMADSAGQWRTTMGWGTAEG